jgi:fucose permease
MRTIDPPRFGFAFGATWALMYLGCALMMTLLSREQAVSFANSLVHGVDWGPIARWDRSWPDTLSSVFCVLVVGWLVGATFASIYNLTLPRMSDRATGSGGQAP